jgi:hypothetical protein
MDDSMFMEIMGVYRNQRIARGAPASRALNGDSNATAAPASAPGTTSVPGVGGTPNSGGGNAPVE